MSFYTFNNIFLFWKLKRINLLIFLIMSDFLKAAGHVVVHEGLKSAGCMVTLLAMLTGFGALCALVIAVFA